MKKSRVLLLMALVLITAMVFTACSAADSNYSNNLYATAPGANAPPMYDKNTSNSGGWDAAETWADDDYYAREPEYAANEDGGNPTATEAPTVGAKIIYTYNYEVETLEFTQSVDRLEALVQSLGGYIESAYVDGLSYNRGEYRQMRYARYTLRLPAAKYSVFKDSVGDIGNVLSSQTSSENVSQQYFDMESRLKSLRVQEERLISILEKADNLTDVIQLERALADVTYQIESYMSALRRLDSLIDYSSVYLTLREVIEPTVTTEPPKTIWDDISQTFSRSASSLGGFFTGLLVFFAGNSPVLLTLALFIVLIILVIRGLIRNDKKKRAAIRAAAVQQAQAQWSPPGQNNNPQK